VHRRIGMRADVGTRGDAREVYARPSRDGRSPSTGPWRITRPLRNTRREG